MIFKEVANPGVKSHFYSASFTTLRMSCPQLRTSSWPHLNLIFQKLTMSPVMEILQPKYGDPELQI
jgi:hypothetical protein